MHLILYHVTKLEEVGNTYRCRLVELLTSLTIIQVSRTESWQSSFISPLSEVVKLSTIKDRSSEFNAQTLAGSTEDSLENLTEVHTRRYTQRVQYQVYRTTILKEWHIFLTYHLRYDTLVTVTTSQLITDTDLTLLGHIHLSHLQDARGQLVTDGDSKLLTLILGIEQLELLHVVDNQLSNQLILVLVVGPIVSLDITILKVLQRSHRKLCTLGNDFSTSIVPDTH